MVAVALVAVVVLRKNVACPPLSPGRRSSSWAGGAAEGKVSVALVIDWRTYCEKWPTIPAALKTLPCAKFWAHNDVKAWFDGPQLCTLGAWYAEIPITNVPSERVFAIMRSCEGHLRHNLTEDSMTEEVSAKCNDWVLEGMLQRQTQLFARK